MKEYEHVEDECLVSLCAECGEVSVVDGEYILVGPTEATECDNCGEKEE